ncbi:hypothetical protein CAOG_009973 [Capsaspora owczarzaki ATCC 30864]|uniref:60S ribosomal export protein NMD3 n=1 Tax=Capsaspora owczarzaki (strain ATCC 30864) TaxID=595528 RepID=A0A0D2ULB6_CAPO3|nr:hypothetical protein CAOG_009973 [Capsaspora owczarzaki ATCC 30864]
MCVDCIRNEVDITDGIAKHGILNWCRNCERYLNHNGQNWLVAELESRELLTLCLKKIRGLGKVRVQDAGFIWTEPHSRRIKVKVVIEKDFNGAIVRHAFVIEFVVQSLQCPQCQRRMANDNWKAIVQVRQRVDHKKTFYFLEQLILKHKAHSFTINIKERPDGLDFYYSSKSDAMKMVDFLNAVAPVTYKTSERLISTDLQSNTSNYKFTYSVDVVPICKNDLVCLPKQLARQLGNIDQLLICYRVGNSVHLIDPRTLQVTEISVHLFNRHPFRALSSQKHLVEYTILEIEPTGVTNGKFAMAEFTAARTRDFGKNDIVFQGRTHLGNVLKTGDTCLGFDIGYLNFNDENANEYPTDRLPDVALIKKTYPERIRSRKNRTWRLQTLNKESEGISKRDEEKAVADFEGFLEDLEEDRELRANINLYRDPNVDLQAAQLAEIERRQYLEQEGEEDPSVGLEELLEDMSINDAGPDAEDAAAELDPAQAALLEQQHQANLAQLQQIAAHFGLPIDHPDVHAHLAAFQQEQLLLYQQQQQQLLLEQQYAQQQQQ